MRVGCNNSYGQYGRFHGSLRFAERLGRLQLWEKTDHSRFDTTYISKMSTCIFSAWQGRLAIWNCMCSIFLEILSGK